MLPSTNGPSLPFVAIPYPTLGYHHLLISFIIGVCASLPFQAMERVVLLNMLRDNGVLPEPWAKEHAKVAALIRYGGSVLGGKECKPDTGTCEWINNVHLCGPRLLRSCAIDLSLSVDQCGLTPCAPQVAYVGQPR